VKITYGINPDFKEIVKCFQANGIMSEKLLKYLSVESVSELRAQQATKTMKDVSDEVLLTLVAIKILNYHYEDYKKLWTLVEKKARKALIPKLNVDAKTITYYVESNPSEIAICFDKAQAQTKS